MKFDHPVWLVIGGCVCILMLWTWRRHDARQRSALAKFVSVHLRLRLTDSISRFGRFVQRGCFVLAMACVCIALAEPLYGFRWEQISRRGNEIVFAVDTSRSMSAPDVKPSRLSRAKLAIDDMAGQLGGDAIGIVAFAGSAFLVCPITLDYEAFHESLAAVDVGTIPLGGTNISSAIIEAQQALHRRPGSDKILILVTDGEDLEGDSLDVAKTAAKEDGLKIFTVGVGTPSGELVPIAKEQGGGFVKDEAGQLVKSHLDEPALKRIAAATGGRYVPLGTHGEGLEELSRTVLASLAKHDLAFRQQKIYTERFQWPLAAGVVLLLLSQVIGTRRRRAGARQSTTSLAKVAGTSAALFLLALRSSPSQAFDAVAGAGAPAAASATDIKAPVRQYNAGTAAYRAGNFSQATRAFQQSIRQAPSSDPKRLTDQQDAYYNLGNALFRDGQKTEQSAPQDTVKTWTDAVKAYETALQLRADDADSKYNRDLVKRKIEELKKKQDQDKNKNQNKNQDKNQDQKPDPNQKPDQPGNQTPPGAGQSPPSPAKPDEPKPQAPAATKAAPGEPSPPAGDQDQKAADNQHSPGGMSREEARELLDSAKSDERHPLGAPLTRRDVDQPPDKPFKNW